LTQTKFTNALSLSNVTQNTHYFEKGNNTLQQKLTHTEYNKLVTHRLNRKDD